MVWLVMVVCSVAVLQQVEGDRKAVETGLLRLLGMEKRPRAVPSLSIVPEDMIQLYKKQTGLDIDTPFLHLPGRMTRSANTVRRFTHSGKEDENRKKRHDRFRLYFNVSEVPRDEKVTAAELKLTILGGEHAQRVLVHDIVRPGIKGKKPPLLRLLDSTKITTKDGGTIQLDVLPAAERWALHPNENYGLLIEILTKRGAKPNIKRLRIKRDLSYHSLLLYLDDGKNKQPTLEQMLSRKKRAQPLKKHRRKDGDKICRRHNLYVDFKDVGWNDWIVAPPGYDAYYCYGDCPFPLADHLNSTNHAVVQTLVHSVNPGAVPKACCVPTQLSSISMLYVDDENIVLKNYQDMAVVGCGCR